MGRDERSPGTEAKYHRWNHGPFSREVLTALAWMEGIEIVEVTTPWAGDDSAYRAGAGGCLGSVELAPEFVKILDRIGGYWRNRPLLDLDRRVYGEKSFRRKAFGEPLL